MKRNCISDDFTFRNAKDWACNSSPIAQRLHSKLCLSPFGQHRNDFTHRHYIFISLVMLKNRTYLSRPLQAYSNEMCIRWYFEFATNKTFYVCIGICCSDWAVSWNLVSIISCAWCRHETAAEDATGHRWHIRGSPQCTFCRQCTTCVLCCSCLSQFQICVCVSRLVRRLPVSKFSLCHSTSTVTKSLCSPQMQVVSRLKENANNCVFIIWTATRILQWTCTETQQRF